MPRNSVQRAAHQRLDEGARASSRYVDLQLDVVDDASGELLYRFGGRWDRKAKDYDGDAPMSRIVRVFDKQLDFFRDLDAWVGDQVTGDRTREDWLGEIVMAGGQRSGKTAMLVVAAIATAISVPGSIVWIVTPSEGFYSEPIAYLEALMPAEWFTSLGWPHWCYSLPNGSQIVLRSAHRTGRLKQGKATAIFVNEAQQVSPEAYAILLGRVFDDGGVVVSAANPPDVGDKGTWLTDYAAQCRRGAREHSAFYLFDPEKNPHIDQRKILDAKSKMDPRTYAIQVKGEFRGLPDQVLYTWDPTENERQRPDLGDVTRQFLQYKEGSARSYDEVVVVDVQNYPWIVATRYKFFANPEEPTNMDRALAWIVGEVFVDQGDELDTGHMLLRAGVKPDRTLMVIDASCFWQQQQRDEDKQRAEWKGKGSAHMFMSFGFKVVRPDKAMKGNPDVIDRCRAAASRICTEGGERLVFADPVLAPRTCETIRKWQFKNGKPDRRTKFAHAGDTVTYGLWRFFPRRRRAGKVDVKHVKSFEGTSRTKGYT